MQKSELDNTEKKVLMASKDIDLFRLGNKIEVNALQTSNEGVATTMKDYLTLCMIDGTRVSIPSSKYELSVTDVRVDKVERENAPPLYKVMGTYLVVE